MIRWMAIILGFVLGFVWSMTAMTPGMQAGAMAETARLSSDQIISGSEYRIVDGDTVHIGEHKIRLIGIDAPERKQLCQTEEGGTWPCGAVARDMLSSLAETAREITCVIDGQDRYKRLLGICFAGSVSGGIDVQKALIRAGLAVAEYDDAYRADEAAARTAGRGIWRGCFTRPKDWRRKKYACN